jgi:hypothetical protein
MGTPATKGSYYNSETDQPLAAKYVGTFDAAPITFVVPHFSKVKNPSLCNPEILCKSLLPQIPLSTQDIFIER